MESKVKKLEDLKDIGGILLHGCFDLVHIGHIRHIRYAKEHFSGPLTVTITADKYIRKGKGRPAFDAETRAEWLAALQDVDYVAIADEPTGILPILTIKPDVYVKGGEYAIDGVLEAEEEAVHHIGGKVFYTEQKEGVSSTRILTGQYLNDRVKSWE